ncbi:hypothetical protein DFP72DRAFT_1082251 [Ephemerocybe angulata]|uniref:Uncharacterized protein n=1 Tax=Ephemerocybe angulata TaxID=980116 RepID=A0A8H6LVF0_9AGAR|nr:hypothetical protein DFP72DRAFT_1082251 [Tulosesus angulatus]
MDSFNSNQQEGAFQYNEQAYDNNNFNFCGAAPNMHIPNFQPSPFAVVTQTQTVTQTTSYFVPLQANFGFQEPQPQPQCYEPQFNAGSDVYPDESDFQPQSGAVGFIEAAPTTVNPLDGPFFDTLDSLWDNVNGNVGGAASQNFGCDYEPQDSAGGSHLFENGSGVAYPDLGYTPSELFSTACDQQGSLNAQSFEYDGDLEYADAFSANSWPTVNDEGMGQGATSEVVNEPFPDWSPEYIAEIQAAIAAAGPVKCEDGEEAQLYLQNLSETSGDKSIDELFAEFSRVEKFGALDAATASTSSTAEESMFNWEVPSYLEDTSDMFKPQGHGGFAGLPTTGNGALVYDPSSGEEFAPGEACMFLP